MMKHSTILHYPFDPEKHPHAVGLIRNVVPGSDLASIRLRQYLVYLADRLHMVRYGRTIVGGAYTAIPDGPLAKTAAQRGEPTMDFQINLDYLSQSDREIISEILAQYGHLSPLEVQQRAKDASWKACEVGCEMDLSICWQDVAEADPAVLGFLRDTQETMEALHRLGPNPY